MLEIREEQAGDTTAIRELHRLAFRQDQEANIVDALRVNGGVLASLVATLNGRVVGHPTRREAPSPTSAAGASPTSGEAARPARRDAPRL